MPGAPGEDVPWLSAPGPRGRQQTLAKCIHGGSAGAPGPQRVSQLSEEPCQPCSRGSHLEARGDAQRPFRAPAGTGGGPASFRADPGRRSDGEINPTCDAERAPAPQSLARPGSDTWGTRQRPKSAPTQGQQNRGAQSTPARASRLPTARGAHLSDVPNGPGGSPGMRRESPSPCPPGSRSGMPPLPSRAGNPGLAAAPSASRRRVGLGTPVAARGGLARERPEAPHRPASIAGRRVAKRVPLVPPVVPSSLRRESGPPAGWGGRCRSPPRPALTVPAAGTIPRAAAAPHRLRSPPPPAARRRCAGAGRWRGPALPRRHRLPPLLPVPLPLRLGVRCRRRQADAQCGAAAAPSRSRLCCRCQIPATVT